MPVSKNHPEVSVILALNKIDEFTEIAISSILNQVDVSFELILVANGDRYESVARKLLRRYGEISCVRVLSTPIPQLTYALNFAVSHTKNDYIARMDADDISVANRLNTQLNVMLEKNLDVLGSDVILIDKDGVELGPRLYPRGEMINKLLPFRNCFCHPSVIFKKAIFYKVRGYNSGLNSEDYDLWLRLMRMGVKWDNIAQPLLYYRIHQSSAQGTRLAYSECLALSVREFFMDKSLRRFLAICSHAVKFIYRKMR
ncbi:glycosyltransferase [Aeromonas allosaccharophila]|uniref:glycosyltransferase n=1 Tax=Aeromonas allosaccharophila TaxID=656 RepID=UPI001119DE85|nr:glycosyltransferase [Aeromonas allosaccharophila]